MAKINYAIISDAAGTKEQRGAEETAPSPGSAKLNRARFQSTDGL